MKRDAVEALLDLNVLEYLRRRTDGGAAPASPLSPLALLPTDSFATAIELLSVSHS